MPFKTRGYCETSTLRDSIANNPSQTILILVYNCRPQGAETEGVNSLSRLFFYAIFFFPHRRLLPLSCNLVRGVLAGNLWVISFLAGATVHTSETFSRVRRKVLGTSTLSPRPDSLMIVISIERSICAVFILHGP